MDPVLNPESNCYRSAGTWIFNRRRWLDPLYLDDLVRLRQVGTMETGFGEH
jgi:hypothetical protein